MHLLNKCDKSLQIICRRWFDVKLPKPRNDIARYMEELTLPIIEKKRGSAYERNVKRKNEFLKSRLRRLEDATEIEQVMSRILRRQIQRSDLAIVIHEFPMKWFEKREVATIWKENGFVYTNPNLLTCRLALEEEKERNLLIPLKTSRNNIGIIIGNGEESLKKSLNLLKKMPQLLPLGCLFQNYLLKKDQMISVSEQILSTENELKKLSNLLSMSSIQLSQLLQQHQLELSSILEIHEKNLEK
ncbi:hypothetical protein SNEBB_007287 [Seison nebaliae]|nr:hypothetical protein SNEBB_007287 [Seison nebaliae]